MKIKAERISTGTFNIYGKVVTMPEGEPTSQAADYKFWSDIADYSIDGPTEIGICKVYKQSRDEISGMERHVDTPEILIPIDAPFLLPLLLDGSPESEIKAFRVDPGEAVVIDKGVWHGACLPVGKNESSYFVIFRRRTPFEDVEKKDIELVEITE